MEKLMTETTSNKYDLLAGMTDLERLYCNDKDKFQKELSDARLLEVESAPDDEGAKNHIQKFSKECDWTDDFCLSLYNTNGFDGYVDTNDTEDILHLKKQEEYERIHMEIEWDCVLDAPSDIEISNIRHRVEGDITFTNPSQAFLTYTKRGAS